MVTKNTIEMYEHRKRKPAAYFRGIVKYGYVPKVEKQCFYISCESYAGGGDSPDLLKMLDWTSKRDWALVERAKTLAAKHKLKFRNYNEQAQ